MSRSKDFYERAVGAEFWEQWVATRKEPVEYLKPGATVRRENETEVAYTEDLFGGTAQVGRPRPGRKLITFPFERDGQQLICEDMPENALTTACEQRRHGDCNHRLGALAEGGVMLALRPTMFVWRCGCPCHNDPQRAGLLV